MVRLRPGSRQVEVLESKNPLFEIPTTGAVAGGEYWFIANPCLRCFDAEGRLWPEEKLRDPVMLKIAL